MSLLDNVRAVAVERVNNASEASPEMIEVAVAYAKHEVTEKQIAKALGVPMSTAQSRIRHALLSAVRTGKLVYTK